MQDFSCSDFMIILETQQLNKLNLHIMTIFSEAYYSLKIDPIFVGFIYVNTLLEIWCWIIFRATTQNETAFVSTFK